MTKMTLSNVENLENADIIIVGLPDNSKSHSKRMGIEKGPDSLRIAYNDSNYFKREGKEIHICPMYGDISDRYVYDMGNTSREKLYGIIHKICKLNKIPITLGGDHSLTTIVLNALSDTFEKKVSLIYFDAHPDFVSSTLNYYGSVLSDSRNAINFDTSLLIGMRAAEPEEITNIKENNVEIVTPLEILEQGISKIQNKIMERCKNNLVYISIDLDCIDPGFAPGVSLPTAAGMSPLEVIYLLKKICSNLKVVGIDIVELSPDYDIQSITANTAARLLLEMIYALQLK